MDTNIKQLRALAEESRNGPLQAVDVYTALESAADSIENVGREHEQTKANYAHLLESNQHARQVHESALAEIFKAAGADADGAADALIAPRALQAVRQLRHDYAQACGEVSAAHEKITGLDARMREADSENESLHKDIDAAQARIDALMLEHCPDEMTAEQRDRWARSQARSSPDSEAAVKAALESPDAGH